MAGYLGVPLLGHVAGTLVTLIGLSASTFVWTKAVLNRVSEGIARYAVVDLCELIVMLAGLCIFVVPTETRGARRRRRAQLRIV